MKITSRKAYPRKLSDFPSLRFALPFCENSLTDLVTGLVYAPTAGQASYHASDGVIYFKAANAASAFGVYDTSVVNAPFTHDFMLVGRLVGFDGLSGSVTLGQATVDTSHDALRLQVISAASNVASDAPAVVNLAHAAGAANVHAIVGRWSGANLAIEYYVDGQAMQTSTIVNAADILFGSTAGTSLLQIVGGAVDCGVGFLAYWSFTRELSTGGYSQAYGRDTAPSASVVNDGLAYLSAMAAQNKARFVLPPMWKGF